MAIELNRPALKHARSLVPEGKVVRDERDDWSEAAPSAADENDFIEKYGWTEFSHWHLGIDRGENPETKQAYSFPVGDFPLGASFGCHLGGEPRRTVRPYGDPG